MVVVLGLYAAIAAAILIPRVPRLRFGANNWWTLASGVAVVLVGTALRDWAIVSLGRYFQRTVTIEPGQRIVRHGPYRALRHPSYTGICLMVAGFGLALGSWVGAVVSLAIVVAGLLPRILVEERALARAFAADYAGYAAATDRLLPYIW